MSKKHHKHHPQPANISAVALEAQAAADLADGKFRKARDAYKILLKQDREKYLPRLVEANSRLAEQMVAQGLVSEAEQVMAYVKTIAPPATMLGLEMRSAINLGDWDKAFLMAAKILGNASDALSPRDRAAAADALVLAFREAPGLPGLPEPLVTELPAITGAIQCVSEARYEQAQDLLRPVPRSSVFADWKVLVKGMAAFYMGESEKAKALLGPLEGEGVPACVASSFLLLLRDVKTPMAPAEKIASEAAAAGACRLLGEGEIAAFLPKAEQLWQAGRVVESYEEMRRASNFPSEGVDLAGALSAFYFRMCHGLKPSEYNRYLTHLDRRVEKEAFKSPAEARWIFLTLGKEALGSPNFQALEDAEYFWRDFIQALPADDPERGKAAALLLERLADVNKDDALAGSGFGFGKENGGEFAHVFKLLEESIQFDPANFPAYLKLLELFGFTERHSEANRLIDKMTKLFPKEKAVLLRAGEACVVRKAFGKGLDYLERAHELDPLDKGALAGLVNGYTQFGIHQYLKQDLEKARAAFDSAMRHAETKDFDLVRGSSFLRARQGILESQFGDMDRGKRLLIEAVESSDSRPALLFFKHMFFRLSGRLKNVATPFWKSLPEHRPRNARERWELYKTLVYTRRWDTQLAWEAENAYVSKCLAEVAEAPFDMEEALSLLKEMGKDRAMEPTSRKLVAAGQRLEPDHPRLRLFSIAMNIDSPETPVEALEEIVKIREVASQRGDVETVRFAGELIKAINKIMAESPSSDFDEDFEGDDDDPLSKEDLEFVKEMDFPIPENVLEGLKVVMSHMTDAEAAKFKRECSSFMPGRIFDLLRDRFAGPKKVAIAPRSASDVEVDQLELFPDAPLSDAISKKKTKQTWTLD